MILFPPAKINLGLKVLNKRDDGFHEIESCMLAIALNDVLEILPAEEFTFVQSGLVVDGDDSSNLCVRAFRLFQKTYGIPNAYIHLRKEIPMGAGLGGGSADASFVLIGLNKLFAVGASDDDLRALASELGSDCPFFISDRAQIGRGRGEKLNEIELNLSGYFLKLINPEIHVSTREAYDGVVFSDASHSLEEIVAEPVSEWRRSMKNDFETSLFKLHPIIEELKNSLYDEGAEYASMTGSGSTVFGIFKAKPLKTAKYYERIIAL